VSKAREINAISSTSTRRGPRSISETKVSLLRSCSAAPVWVRLARRRVRSARQLDQVVGFGARSRRFRLASQELVLSNSGFGVRSASISEKATKPRDAAARDDGAALIANPVAWIASGQL